MKVPPKAPSIDELRARVADLDLIRIMNRVPSPLVDGKYLHFADLLHRTPPEGLSLDEWWLGLRLLRQIPSVQLPLLDKDGQGFRFLLTEPVQEHLHRIDLEAGGQVGMREQITNSDTRNQYCVRSLIEEAITSSQIEGAVTTRQVAKDMLRTNRRPSDTSEQMILNNFRTMSMIREWKDLPLSKDLLFEIQRMLTVDTWHGKPAVGRFRKEDEDVVVGPHGTSEIFHTPPPADELDYRLELLCDFANQDSRDPFIHPVIKAIALHFMIGYDHPFVDGNGRTARAVFYWYMLKQGYWLMEFISISTVINKARSKYVKAYLHTETDNSDLTYFLLHHLQVIRKAVAALHAYIDRRTGELTKLEHSLESTRELNHRQRALISHALRHSGQRYTYKWHAKSHGVTHQTARTDLLDLEVRGLLTKRKVGRQWMFSPVADLESRLRGE